MISLHFKLFPKLYLNKIDLKIITNCGYSTYALGSFIKHVLFLCSLNPHSKPASGTLMGGGGGLTTAAVVLRKASNLKIYTYIHTHTVLLRVIYLI